MLSPRHDPFIKDKLEPAAGLRHPLVAYPATNPNVRVMDERFMVIDRLWARPRAALQGRYPAAFVEDMKAPALSPWHLSNNQSAAVAPLATK